MSESLAMEVVEFVDKFWAEADLKLVGLAAIAYVCP